MRTMKIATLVAAAIGLLLSGAAEAQSPAAGSMEKSGMEKGGMEKGGMQGSPNAAGFGKGDDATRQPMDDTGSAKNMKGPPNANGYDKR